MRIPLLGAILKGVLNAAGYKIENLGEPTKSSDAATKKYVDEHGGGGSGSGATVLTTNGSKIFKDGVEMTSYTTLLELVQAGGVTLMGTVGADKDALYYPLFCDTNAIRFDATGTLGGDVKTKSYTVQPVNGDHIRVSEGSLVDLAKKSDLASFIQMVKSAIVSQNGLQFELGENYVDLLLFGYGVDKRMSLPFDIEFSHNEPLVSYGGIISRSFDESSIANMAKVTEFTLPVSLFDDVKRVRAFDIRCANSSSGTWDTNVSWTFNAISSTGQILATRTSDVQTMVIGQYTRFTFPSYVEIPNDATAVRLTCSGATRVALAPTTDAGYSVKGATGSVITGYGVPVNVIGYLLQSEAFELLAKRSLDPRGGVAANVNLTAPDGTRWALGVNNDGTLYTSIPDSASQSDDGDEEIEI